jgi:hypothetical protein
MADDKSKRGGDVTFMFDCLLDEIEEEDLREVFSEFLVPDGQTTASGGADGAPTGKRRDVAAGASVNRANQTQRGLTHARRQIKARRPGSHAHRV